MKNLLALAMESFGVGCHSASNFKVVSREDGHQSKERRLLLTKPNWCSFLRNSFMHVSMAAVQRLSFCHLVTRTNRMRGPQLTDPKLLVLSQYTSVGAGMRQPLGNKVSGRGWAHQLGGLDDNSNLRWELMLHSDNSCALTGILPVIPLLCGVLNLL